MPVVLALTEFSAQASGPGKTDCFEIDRLGLETCVDDLPAAEGSDLGPLLEIAAFLIALIMASATALLIWNRRRLTWAHHRFASNIVDQIPLGLILLSKDGRIEFANRGHWVFAEPHNPDGYIGRPYSDLIRDLSDPRATTSATKTPADVLRNTIAESLLDGSVTVAKQHDGAIIASSTRHLDDGKILVIRQDITEARRQLEQIQQLNQQLEKQISVANTANDELRAFAYATSHDLRSPANTAMMLADLLRENLDGKLSTDDLELLDDLRNTSKRMGDLIEDTLTYTNTIGSDPTRKLVDLRDCVAGVVDDLRADFTVTDAQITVGELPTVSVHPTQIRQLIQNLVSNAIKFQPSGQTPSIQIEPADAPAGYSGFSVTDNGIGIAPRDRDEIFKLFNQLHNNSEYQGTGLGLSICYRIALNHGGHIEVSDGPEGGTRFTVLIEGRLDDRKPDGGRRQCDRSKNVSPDRHAIGVR
ncbi:MAG: ATP-binding protein [Pseudomonadota bacterium]